MVEHQEILKKYGFDLLSKLSSKEIEISLKQMAGVGINKNHLGESVSEEVSNLMLNYLFNVQSRPIGIVDVERYKKMNEKNQSIDDLPVKMIRPMHFGPYIREGILRWSALFPFIPTVDELRIYLGADAEQLIHKIAHEMSEEEKVSCLFDKSRRTKIIEKK